MGVLKKTVMAFVMIACIITTGGSSERLFDHEKRLSTVEEKIDNVEKKQITDEQYYDKKISDFEQWARKTIGEFTTLSQKIQAFIDYTAWIAGVLVVATTLFFGWLSIKKTLSAFIGWRRKDD